MLDIIKPLDIATANDAARGDVHVMLESLLIEVLASNYRYFLQERLHWAAAGCQPEERYCWAPLLARERQVSGLFVQALSNVCPVSRPELPIVRTRWKGKRDQRTLPKESTGRVDYYATFGQRSVGIELKRTQISTQENKKDRVVLAKNWSSVGKQAQQALDYMRKFPIDFPYAVAVGLLVIPLMRSVLKGQDAEAELAKGMDRIKPMEKEIIKALDPDFLSIYRPQRETQIVGGWGENGEGFKLFPAVFFAATVRVKASARKKTHK